MALFPTLFNYEKTRMALIFSLLENNIDNFVLIAKNLIVRPEC